MSKFADVTGRWGDCGVEEMHLAFVQEKPPNGASKALRDELFADGAYGGSFAGFASFAQQQLINAGFYGSDKKNLRVEVFLNKLLGIPPAAAQHIFFFFTICVDCARQKAPLTLTLTLTLSITLTLTLTLTLT